MIYHYTRNDSGGFDVKECQRHPMVFVQENIPDGVPFTIYRDSIGADKDVTKDFELLANSKRADVFHIVESAGGGGSGFFHYAFDALGLIKGITKLLSPQPSTSSNLSNSQGQSANNSLTDRNNKSRPYERAYDICGTVQSIPNDLMTVYKTYNSSGNIIEYGYYCIGRGPLDTPASGITDGDTKMSEITGSSAAVYPPFVTPNNGSPSVLVGDAITEKLYITVTSNEIDGATLKAQNDLASNVGDSSTASYNSALQRGTITDNTGDSEFNQYLKVGDMAKLTNIVCDLPGDGTEAILNGTYPVVSISATDIVLNVSSNPSEWAEMGATTYAIQAADDATVGPVSTYDASLTDWVTMDRIKQERLVVNIGAEQGMYKDDGNRKRSTSVTCEAQYQLLDDNGVAYGPIYTAQGTVTGRSADDTGVTIFANLPTPSACRVRCRRVTNKDFDFNGQVVDEVKYNNLYGQVRDTTPDYGNLTTVHTARRQTARATSIKSPQLKMLVTERLYKYLGNGVFDTSLSNNTQAVQSLIRLLRDPIVGNLNLTAANMDRLLATQNEIETYFQNPLAGQFCYTFDSYDTTTQDIISAIADAVFCYSYREGSSVLFDFDRPRQGPEMVFTHRSKIPDSEKWTRNFNDRSTYDSLKFGYIDPATNVKETISIPPEGGVKTETYDSKGIRNYQQAFWAAWRRYQRNTLNRVSVDFSSTEEGVFVRPGRAISVVKGSRVSPYDGYVVSVNPANTLELTLSQNVEFTPGDEHFIILKKRDGSVQSVEVVAGSSDRKVIMLSAPQETIYTGNNAQKTEFSFGSEERHKAQMMVVTTVSPSGDRTAKISGYNYTQEYYAKDGVPPFGRAFSNGFSNGFS